MMRARWAIPAVALAALAAATPAVANVTGDEAATLGGELTPLGATAAGNESGSIPAWRGGITKPPAGYAPGMHHPDPFADDKPLFTITADNFQRYKANLSPGQVALFQR